MIKIREDSWHASLIRRYGNPFRTNYDLCSYVRSVLFCLIGFTIGATISITAVFSLFLTIFTIMTVGLVDAAGTAMVTFLTFGLVVMAVASILSIIAILYAVFRFADRYADDSAFMQKIIHAYKNKYCPLVKIVEAE